MTRRHGLSRGLSQAPPSLPLTRAIGEAGGGGFSPLQLPSLVAWYDPSDLSTMFQDAAGTIPVTAAGQAVARINDKSGNGRHATQATGAAQPLLQQDGNGNYYLDFDGTDDFLGVNYAQSAYPLTLACAAKADTDVDSSPLSLHNSTLIYKSAYKGSVANQWAAIDRNASIISDALTVGTNTTPHVLIAEFKTATTELFMDGTSNGATANTNAFGASAQIFLGKARDTGLFLNGRVYGAIVSSASWTAGQRNAAGDYLAGKSGAAW